MTVQTTVSCYLCGIDGKPMEMAVLASPAIGHRIDLALIGTWLCQEPCFDKARHSRFTSPRIYSGHNKKQADYKANLQEALITTIATRLDPAHLPEGLRVTADDLERVALLDGDFSVENLQDEATIQAAFKLLRNHKKLSYYHCKDGVGEFWDYEELKTRLDNLARSNA